MGKYIGRENQYGVLDTQDLSSVINSSTTVFNLTYRVADTSSLLVVYTGSVQQPNVDYTVINSGTQISFTSAPALGQTLYIKYLGKEVTVPSIPSFTTYTSTISATTALSSVTIAESTYQEFTGLIKTRLSFSGTTDAITSIDKVNFTLPVNNNGSNCILSSAIITSSTTTEQGIVVRNSNTSFDVYRASATAFALNTAYEFNIITEYRV